MGETAQAGFGFHGDRKQRLKLEEHDLVYDVEDCECFILWRRS